MLIIAPADCPYSAWSECDCSLNSWMSTIDGLKEKPPKNGSESRIPSTKNVLLRLDWPSTLGLTAPAPKLGALPAFCELSMGTTPGESSSSCENCRPFKGRSCTCCCGI